MDLQTLQNQLRSAIQNHQIVVAKMRSDPQNTSLQKQLHDLQAEIMLLSDKQKQVVQQLRKDLEKKQQVTISKAHNNAIQSASRNSVTTKYDNQHAHHHGDKIQVGPKHRTSVIPKHSYQVQTRPISLTTKPVISSQPRSQQKVAKQTVPSATASNSVASAATTLTIKSPVATVLLPAAGARAAHSLLTARPSDDQRTRSVLVVPSVGGRASDNGRATGMVLNLSSPIRVPQYPPPQSKPLPAKKSFMAALGLITKDTLKELQSKRYERKRRTTANPQFSNAAVEERKRNAALQSNDPILTQPFKRPRGRPRLNATPTNSRPSTPENASPVGVQTASLNGSSPPEQILPEPAVQPTQQQQQQEQKEVVTAEVQGTCDACGQPGDATKTSSCSACGQTFHLGCLQPPLLTVPDTPWSCSKCSQSCSKPGSSQLPETLAVVHSYIALKSAKEEEKRKLLRRSMELKTELQQLQDRFQQLKETMSGQNRIKMELQENRQKTQESIEKLHNVVGMFKRAS